jgi:hypothetical protein
MRSSENQLFGAAFELLDPAVVLPEFNVVTVDHLPGTFLRAVVIVADEIDGFHEMAVTADQICAIIRHDRMFLYSGDLSSP